VLTSTEDGCRPRLTTCEMMSPSSYVCSVVGTPSALHTPTLIQVVVQTPLQLSRTTSSSSIQVVFLSPNQYLLTYRLQSGSCPHLIVPRTWPSTIGDRSFRVTVAQAGNNLPTNVTASTSLPSFKRQLKTFLFTRSFPSL